MEMANDHKITPVGENHFSSPYDPLNRQIIAILQEDGRTSFRTIADQLNVSEGTVRNRVTWMKEAGELAIVAIIDPSSLTYRADAILGINVAPGHTPASVAERLGACSNVVYILWASGRYDRLVEVVFDDESEFAPFLESYCYKDKGIAHIEIMQCVKMFKNQFLLKRNLLRESDGE
jgi:Lrp/AsnC family transcriptional regulator for asnA, asnC and gidA